MSAAVPLEVLPQQSLTIQLEGRRYGITLRYAGNIMAIDIVRDEVDIIIGQRCVPSEFLLPYKYLEDESGNFFFATENDELPIFTLFGDTQSLIYLSNSDLVTIRGV